MDRKRIYEIIEKSGGDDILSSVYDFFMIFIIALSLLPLAFKADNTAFYVIDKVCVAIFIIDYILRWCTADYKFAEYRYTEKPVLSFIRYPFSFMALVDLLSILPSLTIISNSFKILRVLRMIRALRVIRIFKAMRYSHSIAISASVIEHSRRALGAVMILAVGYILVSALIVFNVEPD